MDLNEALRVVIEECRRKRAAHMHFARSISSEIGRYAHMADASKYAFLISVLENMRRNG